MYPEPRVEQLIRDNLIPVRIKIRENPGPMERFNVQWTPTVLLLGSDGKEHHRIEGFLETEDFLAQLTLGLGHIARAEQKWKDAERRYREVLEQLPSTDAAAEAQYWLGVTRYKATNDAAALGETARAFKEKYADSPWAKKASIWG